MAYPAPTGKVQAIHNVHKLSNPLIHDHDRQIVSSVVVSSQLSCTKRNSFRLSNGLVDEKQRQ